MLMTFKVRDEIILVTMEYKLFSFFYRVNLTVLDCTNYIDKLPYHYTLTSPVVKQTLTDPFVFR